MPDALGIRRNNIKTSEKSFDNIPGLLSPLMGMEDMINTCAKSRNTVGHNLVWATGNLTVQSYNILVKNIASSCLHSISKLFS